MRRLYLLSIAFFLVQVASSAIFAADAALENQAYRLEITLAGGQVHARLLDKISNAAVADGPYLYRAEREEHSIAKKYPALENARAAVEGDKIVIRGELAGLELEHTFCLPVDRPIMEEYLTVKNAQPAVVALTNLETGFTRQVSDERGQVLPEVRDDRLAMVPFRAKPVDLGKKYNDFSIAEFVREPGSYVHVVPEQSYIDVPAPLRTSEGWAWTHGRHAMGIFKFDQENMQWTVLAVEKIAGKAALRFGGVSMIDEEPSDLSRIQPGQTVKLGKTRYQTVSGGYNQASYAFRKFLDENNCRFPKNFNPPVHWEQLYDMEGAWDDRLHRYTKAILEKEAKKGIAYSCEDLYLDPGWDSDFATFYWGERWLGPRKQFIEEMQSKYGLKVSLHTPLASWMSHPSLAMGGPSAPSTYPQQSHRKAPTISDPHVTPAPLMDNAKRNLALLPEAKAGASSVYADGTNPLHQIAHLNDGWQGNRRSWIAKDAAGWAEIDLGGVHKIAKVKLSNDFHREHNDRQPVDYRILTATTYAADSDAPSWSVVAEEKDKPLLGVRQFDFPPREARFVRVQITKSAQGQPRLDEIEIYEDQPLSEKDMEAWKTEARRSPPPSDIPYGVSTICLGSTAYREEAAKRLLENCADGVVFVMFDGNWYQGGCDDPSHGHPVPYTKEDHIRANLDLARRVHEKYPRVLIEMHDMLMGGACPRNTPVYYKYGLPGSYDLNWGFELMWSSFGDVASGRARSLYYYNLGCNVPIYLHINLRDDTPGCASLWWYASTCRHLGIGGTHANTEVLKNQQQAMKWYRAHERFYKRGEFYGINEEIHLHVLPEENAFTANVFNLSAEERVISGGIDLKTLGLNPALTYESAEGLGRVENGRCSISVTLPPWTAKPAAFEAKK
jgi:hypothetical protein